MAKGHDIQLSELAAAGIDKKQGGARAAAGGGLTEAELEQLEQYAENVLKPLLVKPHTPGKSAIPAENLQFRDKSAEDRRLQQAYDSGSCAYFRGREWAKPAQKADFSVDSCK